MGLSEITKPCIYPLHLLKSLFLLPVPQVAQKSYFIAERCQNFKQALSLSPASPSSFPLIPERLGHGRLLTLTCSSARIMLASLCSVGEDAECWRWRRGERVGTRERRVFQTGGTDRVKMGVKGGRCMCVCGMRWGVSASDYMFRKKRWREKENTGGGRHGRHGQKATAGVILFSGGMLTSHLLCLTVKRK